MTDSSAARRSRRSWPRIVLALVLALPLAALAAAWALFDGERILRSPAPSLGGGRRAD